MPLSEQEAVTVVGYPLGGDTISVTKGVVSRIEVWFLVTFDAINYASVMLSWNIVFMSSFLSFLYYQVTSYAHGSSDLLGIQIDAAINPGW